MSCKDCEKEQDMCANGNGRIAYYRVENGNVAVIGCPKHIKIMFDKLNAK